MEAKLAEITKTNILERAKKKCEICGARLGYGEGEVKPEFHYIVPPFKGGSSHMHTNISVLCPTDGERIDEIPIKVLNDKISSRETMYRHS